MLCLRCHKRFVADLEELLALPHIVSQRFSSVLPTDTQHQQLNIMLRTTYLPQFTPHVLPHLRPPLPCLQILSSCLVCCSTGCDTSRQGAESSSCMEQYATAPSWWDLIAYHLFGSMIYLVAQRKTARCCWDIMSENLLNTTSMFTIGEVVL